jgi:signal transduction histidine kinase
VLTNLLDNAIKYSPDGGAITVTLGQTPEELTVSVRDHGLGIPPEQRGRIFDRFFQAHQDAHRSGLGLGLYISQQIVELHGGQITVEFPPDGGTCFVVHLPIVLAVHGSDGLDARLGPEQHLVAEPPTPRG